jgi:hypothetical protein
MAILYALPSLKDWFQKSGWSYTSGGSPANVTPGDNFYSRHTAVFDENSGNSRLITGNGFAKNLIMRGSQPMLFTDGYVDLAGGGDCVLNGTFKSLQLNTPQAYSSNSTRSVYNIDVTNATFEGFTISNCGCNITKGDLIITGEFYLVALDKPGAISFVNPGALMKCGWLIFHVSFGGITIPNGTLEVTGVSPPSHSYPGYAIGMSASSTSGSISLGDNGVLKISDKSSTVKKVLFKNFTGHFVNDAGISSVQWDMGVDPSGTSYGIQSFKSYNAGVGCGNSFFSGSTVVYTADSWIINGTGILTKMASSSASLPADLRLTNGGTITASWAEFTRIRANSGTNIVAINSTNVAGNIGITFLQIVSRFFPFF